ncbi:MAG TPA: ABC transporter permease subunit [Thermoflexia bacterium]|jgi:ABC-type Na+ efflux pump permease subunit|nr:ABC transporter permease subunit [Thermoflexia bacterium]
MNWRAIKAIVRKDLKVVVRNKGVFLPLILVPTIILVAMPALVALAPSTADLPISPLTGLDAFLENMPPGLQAELADLDEAQRWVVLALVYFLAPMYLIIPLMVASVIAADSFAGEKERKTLEALLYTPTTDGELFLGKVLSAWLPAMEVALGGFVLYGLVANLAAWPVMGRVFFPNGMWLVLVGWVAPAVAGLGLSTMVLISVRARGFQEAYQLGGAVVLPILLLVVGQATGVMHFNIGMTLLLGLFLWGVDAALLWLGGRTFRRSDLAARL